ncbi:10305_t:CDS:2 [Diversispora eburnea]|uniref:10305_t:CDS:1 n=1 Tax=Diversispora eburnea TaxID=1213867 RepID=A0A9N9BJH0_9GLOM|nr:10305_t:CDS:2 [Diversispora eburnea]
MSNITTVIPNFCDWRIELYNCEMSQLWVIEVIISLVSYVILSITGTFVFWYRYKYMWQGLFVDHGNGIRPLPVDCLLFFWTIGCYFRGLHSLLMLLNAYTAYWQREMLQESGWTIICYGAICYIVGIIYTIPANYTHGSRAVIKIETKRSDLKYSTSRDIYLPTPTQLNWILAIWCLLPTVTVFPFSILSGISRDHGKVSETDQWTSAQYITYFVLDTIFALSGIYYGINFMLILRSTVKQFSRTSISFQRSKHGTREALDRLKYTMTYIAVLPLISGPWWGIFGIYHTQIISSINGVNLFLSVMWHITGIQPLIVVVQYVLAKRVYLHYTGQTQSSGGDGSLSSTSQSNAEVTDHRATLNRSHTNTNSRGIVVDTKDSQDFSVHFPETTNYDLNLNSDLERKV